MLEVRNWEVWRRFYIYLCFRYGQEDIETLLRSKGANELVDIPKKLSVLGEVDPPWVRKSSRREQATS
jgi:hypothetical protein